MCIQEEHCLLNWNPLFWWVWFFSKDGDKNSEQRNTFARLHTKLVLDEQSLSDEEPRRIFLSFFAILNENFNLFFGSSLIFWSFCFFGDNVLELFSLFGDNLRSGWLISMVEDGVKDIVVVTIDESRFRLLVGSCSRFGSNCFKSELCINVLRDLDAVSALPWSGSTLWNCYKYIYFRFNNHMFSASDNTLSDYLLTTCLFRSSDNVLIINKIQHNHVKLH